MYNNKTTNILKIIIKFGYAALAITLVWLWYSIKPAFLVSTNVSGYAIIFLIPIAYSLVVPAGYVALVYIDKLLSNVKNETIFEKSTTKYLDIISYSCVYASIIGFISALVCLSADKLGISSTIELIAFGDEKHRAILILALAFGELFMALILKVIKKVFQKAIELKEENDLTI